jgi:opacity protein-like surface antigen
VKRCLFIFLSLFLFPPVLSHGEMTHEESVKVGEAQDEATPAEGPKVERRTREWGVALGLRSTYFHMTQNTGHFVGAVNDLPEEQNFLPIKPLVQINLSKYLAFELGYDRFKAGTLNSPFTVDGVTYAEHDPRFNDGNITWAPFMLALQFRWPHFHKNFVPYVLGGLSYTKTSWERKDWYYYGFPWPWVYDDWVNQGKRPEDYPNGGYRRIYAVEDHTIGALLGLGVDYFIWKNIALNLDWRYHWAKANFTYSLAYDGGQTVVHTEQRSFFLDSWIIGLGLKYFF